MRLFCRRGMSVIELMVACSIFLTLVLFAFAIFDFGVRATARVNTSSSLQSSATRTILLMQNDLRRSNRSSVLILSLPPARVATVNGVMYQRHAVCFAGMNDWFASTAFNPKYGSPNFDRYVVYYATTETPVGRLIRAVYGGWPSPPDGLAPPMSPFTDLNCQNDPQANGGQLSYSVLSQNVRQFICTERADGRLSAALTLFDVGLRGPAGGTKRMDQSYEMELEVYPQNTWPRE